MGELRNGKSIGTVGRVLDYELSTPDEKVSDFKRRVEEQIEVLRIAIKNGSVNDPKIAENYAQKAERFLSIPYFSDKKSGNKSVRNLKNAVKFTVGIDKEISGIIKNWLVLKRRKKVILADRYSTKKEDKFFSYGEEIQGFYCADMDFLNTSCTVYTSKRIVANRLLGIISSQEIVSALGIKNSWKVEYLRKVLKDNRDKLQAISDEEYSEIMALPYLRDKKYLTMEVRNLRKDLEIYVKILERVEDWIDEQYRIAQDMLDDLGNTKVSFAMNAKVDDILRKYDKFLEDWTHAKQAYDNEYSLYHFGQGLIEADIFASLYK